MLLFKKEILIEVGQSQETTRTEALITAQIEEADKQYEEEMQMNQENEDAEDDRTAMNVKERDSKVEMLHHSVSGLYKQFSKLQLYCQEAEAASLPVKE